MGSNLDDIDRGVLYLLQQDARNTTAIDMAEELDVSPSTVRNRIDQLEEDDVLAGYHPQINYEHTGFPLLAIFIVTAAPADRAEAVEHLLEIDGVFEIREMLGGNENIHVNVLAKDNCHLSNISDKIHAVDVEIEQTELTKQCRTQPVTFFSDPISSDETESADGT
ncbi:winged helix-turn-helix transcriptional regulator [Haloterrigena sp. SYSU A121-1]|uniref:Winged helix-turn-helix transcriptional regulator n=1 Tax=Haloterrigena gelatinilytica TaxID=2741724 RepID=A0A8J8KHH9_9EURY|nr:winged helix-turn-helix transcriptional regulator [Haloterrigena gelatinilytica]NUB91169.1 winged helix-turn-helix transcriptional regulator [Haloterrigena gelatinilytica]